ncbi:hypothetical protein WISP_43655 [Willisornis vidua]|uniref:Ubiquitin carboxyl-terminal hydrolase n=1 Tax=Willisornis vidua TaxID=1566151 RepID=A0ABQ9DGR4_9PASS|nr:hypothetical protein WISP_43655 [Willisornis vidua]
MLLFLVGVQGLCEPVYLSTYGSSDVPINRNSKRKKCSVVKATRSITTPSVLCLLLPPTRTKSLAEGPGGLCQVLEPSVWAELCCALGISLGRPGVGLDDPDGSLPSKDIPWLYDFVAQWLYDDSVILCFHGSMTSVIVEGMTPPQRILFPPEEICMDWQQRQRPGAGLRNLGSTCYINVVLQCLTYTPPLTNYLLSREHSRLCFQEGFCMMCIMEAHVRKVLRSSASAIWPRAVIRDLKFTCLRCQAVSDSYKAFLHILLDIKFVEYPEYLDLLPYMSDTAGEPLLYSLYAVVVHSGDTCLDGHFFCYTKASNGLWYKMDDESVDNCALHAVLGQQAYLLFYARCSDLKMREMASSSLTPSHAHSFLSQCGASSKQTDSAEPQGLPDTTPLMCFQRKSARERTQSRSSQWDNDHHSWFVQSTNDDNSTGRKRKRTSPPGHEHAPQAGPASGPFKRICQLASAPCTAQEQPLQRQREQGRSLRQGYGLRRRFVEITDSHQSAKRRRKHSYGINGQKSQSQN